ncbi:MAG: ribonuclease D [Acidobacteria bacterium]|nr:MAG: ribonuclease D [Acidobacteriota bacterium]
MSRCCRRWRRRRRAPSDAVPARSVGARRPLRRGRRGASGLAGGAARVYDRSAMELPPLNPELVTDADAVRRVCRRAAAVGTVALDTESDSLHSYHHKVCLIQLSFNGEHAVLDPLAIGRDGLQPLAEVLADPGVLKLMHGADYDLRVLDRDLGARVVHLVDTQLAAQLLGEPQTGLAALVEREAGVTLDKRYQRADWGARPLPAELLAYAAGDTAYLELVRARLAARLDDLGRGAWWAEECGALEAVRWEAPVPDPLAFERIKGAKKLAGEARDRIAALHAWREGVASADDVPPFKILRGETMLALAVAPPADLEALGATPGVGRGTVRRAGKEILRVLASPPPLPPRAKGPRFAVDREREGRVQKAREARDLIAKELAIEPGVLAPRAALEKVVDGRPADEVALAECLGRRWRASVLAPALLPLAAAWREGARRPDAAPA